jgi:hypothetical protein
MPHLLPHLSRSLGPGAAVAIGIASSEYSNHVLVRHPQGVSAFGTTGGAMSVACGRYASVRAAL